MLKNYKHHYHPLSVVLVLAIALGSGVVLFAQMAEDPGGEEQNFVYSADERRDPFVSLFNKPEVEAQTQAGRQDELNTLLQNVTVNGVLWDSAQPLAMINNKIYKVGDAIERALLIKAINPNDVVLEFYDLTYTITLINEKRFEDQGGF